METGASTEKDVRYQEGSPSVSEGAGMELHTVEQAVLDVRDDLVLRSTEMALRMSIRMTSQDVLQRATSPSASDLQILLCRMLPMTKVRIPLKTDVDKLKGEFLTGYRPGSSCFYVALRSFSLFEKEVLPGERASWSPLWQEEDRKFEALLASRPEYASFRNKYFHVWVGNHCHMAWMEVISQMHSSRVEFHAPVRAVILEPMLENKQILLNGMTDCNKQKETDHVTQQLTHDLKRIQHFGLLDFEELKGLINEADYDASVTEWGKVTKKNWYHMTHDAFLRLMYERDLIAVQEEEI